MSNRRGKPTGLIAPLTKTFESTTLLGLSPLLCLIPLLTNFFDHLGHKSQHFVGILVSVSLPDPLDRLPEPLELLVPLLSKVLVNLRINDHSHGSIRLLHGDRLLRLGDQ